MLVDQLMEDIKAGGLVVAPSRAGKTSAIIKLMLSDHRYYYVARNAVECAQLAEKFQMHSGRFVTPFSFIGGLLEAGNLFIIDECFTNPAFFNWEACKWHAAVGCSDYRIKLYSNNGSLLAEPAELWKE